MCEAVQASQIKTQHAMVTFVKLTITLVAPSCRER
ncbi:hypothetical protein AXFE_11290 [Acidithrix ferrooxidans]|uniref:Uncharacterized protein n=1 Tax=Acidithrix ferrooxidans TaxID=1280514 RepID=A0A0D8HLQ7_9ACTN|nr:hypothetical protein AXFE_11290 [Acidithrix ferrooxidans]